MPKVFIVDDDSRVRLTISEWLEHERFEVEEASCGKEAREKLATCTFDLIVMDWNLGDAEGVDICRWYRARGGNTPILMLTGKDVIEDKIGGFDAGVDDYLTKPFDLMELTVRLNALLRRGGTVAPSRKIDQGGVSIDPKAHKVTIDGKVLHLTPKEFDVFDFLLRHPDQVFSADTLLDRLWKSDAELSLDTVRVYIKRLRDKLEKHGRGNLIVNIRGVGYKVDLAE